MKIRDLAIELLTQDGGISQAAYEILHEMLDGDLDITGHVEATDGCFYLPEGWEPNADQSFDKSYLTSKVHTIIPGAALDMDNDGQIVVYTGLMLDSEGRVVPLVTAEAEAEA